MFHIRNGGRLLLTTSSPYEPPNTFGKSFGITFIYKKIKDEANHEGKHTDHIIVKNLKDHPINENVKVIYFRKYGCLPIEVNRPAIVLATSSPNADPPNKPVAVLVPYGNGQVLAIGQTRIFDDYIHQFDNKIWLKNILTFLVSEKASSHLAVPPPPPP